MLAAILTSVLGLSSLQTRAAVGAESPQATRDAFVATAQQIDSLHYATVLASRLIARPYVPELEPLAQLFARHDPLESLLALLAHADPKVRTLALLALYDREDPKLLPRIVELVADPAATFPEPQPIAAEPPPGVKAPVEPRTVGACARMLVEHYLRAAGFFYGIEGANTEPGFETYWKQRKERAFCASWLLVRQERAFSGASPSLKARIEDLRGVRAEVDQLPATDRALILLWLPDLQQNFTTETERVEAARSLGREKLLAILRREVPSDDPDLLPGEGARAHTYACAGIVRFVLMHARELLLPTDASTLLVLGRAEHAQVDDSSPSMASPWWDIAAANLEPAKAKDTLDLAYLRIAHAAGAEAAQDRAELMKAYWKLGAENADVWLAERFYSESLESDFEPPARTELLTMLGEDGTPRAHATLARLVREAGFAQLDGGTLHAIASAVNRWVQPEILSSSELWGLSHPYGVGRLSTSKQLEAATKEYPAQTRTYLAELDRWRAKIRESVARWAPAAGK